MGDAIGKRRAAGKLWYGTSNPVGMKNGCHATHGDIRECPAFIDPRPSSGLICQP